MGVITMAEHQQVPGTYIFDKHYARQGYHLNKFAMSLTNPANREAFRADEDAYLSRYALTPEQAEAVRARDWLRLVHLGGNIYYIFKLTALGEKPMRMSEVGACQTGMSHEEFLAMLHGQAR
jgi:protocatechuate 4,5-dioxygenase alpha chain